MLYKKDGSLLTCSWVHGEPVGATRLIEANGTIYEGSLLNWKKHGSGKQTSDDTTFVGTFQHGLKMGNGTETRKDGTIFEGNFENDKKQGTGKLILPDGSTYEGDFFADEISGRGNYHWADGRRYKG